MMGYFKARRKIHSWDSRLSSPAYSFWVGVLEEEAGLPYQVAGVILTEISRTRDHYYLHVTDKDVKTKTA